MDAKPVRYAMGVLRQGDPCALNALPEGRPFVVVQRVSAGTPAPPCPDRPGTPHDPRRDFLACACWKRLRPPFVQHRDLYLRFNDKNAGIMNFLLQPRTGTDAIKPVEAWLRRTRTIESQSQRADYPPLMRQAVLQVFSASLRSPASKYIKSGLELIARTHGANRILKG